jgi:twitching motility protein PilI
MSEEIGAFEVLLDLPKRGESVPVDLPTLDDKQTHWTGLGFSLIGQRFVAPMDEVAELMRMPQATWVPGVKSFVVGVGNVHGRLMSILDLDVYFDES